MVCGLMPDPWIYSILFGQETNSTAGLFFSRFVYLRFFFHVEPADVHTGCSPAYKPTTLSGRMLFLQSALAGLQLRRPTTPSPSRSHHKERLPPPPFFFFFFSFYDSLAAVKPGVVMQGGEWGSGHRRLLERM